MGHGSSTLREFDIFTGLIQQSPVPSEGPQAGFCFYTHYSIAHAWQKVEEAAKVPGVLLKQELEQVWWFA